MEGHETKPIIIEASQWEGLDSEVRQHLSDALAESGHVIVSTEATHETPVTPAEAPVLPSYSRPTSGRPNAKSATGILGAEKARELRDSLAEKSERAHARVIARKRNLTKFKKGLYPRLK